MGSYAMLRQMDVCDETGRDGMMVNNHFISYFQVESVLYSYPKVMEAGVIVKCQKGENENLMVYLALEDSFASVEEREHYCTHVKEYIRQNFSLRMPINIHIKDKLPMTKSGKILRSILQNY